ncbi:hypothetical protein ACFRIB_01480 [Streptomyces mirabilis]|uniref:hypothetical protein n=1 Tax=Streptomyces mirabilis TaxID=68239 RepID=UPI0036935EEB
MSGYLTQLAVRSLGGGPGATPVLRPPTVTPYDAPSPYDDMLAWATDGGAEPVLAKPAPPARTTAQPHHALPHAGQLPAELAVPAAPVEPAPVRRRGRGEPGERRSPDEPGVMAGAAPGAQPATAEPPGVAHVRGAVRPTGDARMAVAATPHDEPALLPSTLPWTRTAPSAPAPRARPVASPAAPATAPRVPLSVTPPLPATRAPVPAEPPGPPLLGVPPSAGPLADPARLAPPAEPAPVIQVTIGRIEVRAAAPPSPPGPRRRAPERRPALDLGTYLRAREEGR